MKQEKEKRVRCDTGCAGVTKIWGILPYVEGLDGKVIMLSDEPIKLEFFCSSRVFSYLRDEKPLQEALDNLIACKTAYELASNLKAALDKLTACTDESKIKNLQLELDAISNVDEVAEHHLHGFMMDKKGFVYSELHSNLASN